MEKTTSQFGSDIKLSLDIDFGDDKPFDFFITFLIDGFKLVLKKKQLIEISEDKYIICIKAPNTVCGQMKAFITAMFLDTDFPDNVHTIVEPVEINHRIIDEM